MRSTKELLEVMKEHVWMFNPLFTVSPPRGLCTLAVKLYLKNIITIKEFIHIEDYIRENKPSVLSDWDSLIHRITNPFSEYYWKEGEIEPRIKWIEKHIEKNSEVEFVGGGSPGYGANPYKKKKPNKYEG